MINIYLNDEPQNIEPETLLQALLLQNQLSETHFAVAINNRLIPRADYCSTSLQADDRVDIIVPMQGG